MRAHNILLLLVATTGAVGCVGGEDIGRGSEELTLVDPGTRPLEALGTRAWQMAPAGCEDRLDAEVGFRIASGRDGLVAALDARGRILCVDTLESVQEELEEEGRGAEADELGARFIVGVARLESGDFQGDPSPQPSTQMRPARSTTSDGTRGGDPSPQPS